MKKAANMILATLLVMPVTAGMARAAHFTVDSTADSLDAAPGDGVCDNGQGTCTLRAAILEANALAGADQITLQIYNSPHLLSYAGAQEDLGYEGDLDITGELYITAVNVGPATPSQPAQFQRPIIDAGALDRVFDVRPGAKMTIRSVIIRNGIVGGIRNEGTLTVFSTIVTGNEAGGSGGGISNEADATLNLTNSAVTDNFAHALNGGGGGGVVNRGTLTLVNSTVSGNATNGNGGGIYNSTLQSQFNAFQSTISGNWGGDGAGGIDHAGSGVLVNSTVSANHYPADHFEEHSNYVGIMVHAESGMSLYNSTVTGHGFGIKIGSYEDAWGERYVGVVWLVNTIVARNNQSDCVQGGGALYSTHHNLDSDGTCTLGGGDVSGVDPLLGPLQDNGGPTQTHALLLGSPAIDAGDNASCSPIDQRGFARPQGATCDIGAYEMGKKSFMEGQHFSVTMTGEDRQRSTDCLRFQRGGSLASDARGSGTWRDQGLYGSGILWSGEVRSSSGARFRLEGQALLDGRLTGTGTDDSGLRYAIEGVKNAECGLR